VRTSLCDHRSKTKLIESRSILRNSGLMCSAKFTGSSESGSAPRLGACAFRCLCYTSDDVPRALSRCKLRGQRGEPAIGVR
jgi:hypothetical protein